MSSAPCVILLTTRRSSLTKSEISPTTMALDVLSLNSGHSSRVHDTKEHEAATDGSTARSTRRMNEKKNGSPGSAKATPTMSMRSITVSMRSLAEKEEKRRRKKEKRMQEKRDRESNKKRGETELNTNICI